MRSANRADRRSAALTISLLRRPGDRRLRAIPAGRRGGSLGVWYPGRQAASISGYSDGTRRSDDSTAVCWRPARAAHASWRWVGGPPRHAWGRGEAGRRAVRARRRSVERDAPPGRHDRAGGRAGSRGGAPDRGSPDTAGVPPGLRRRRRPARAAGSRERRPGARGRSGFLARASGRRSQLPGPAARYGRSLVRASNTSAMEAILPTSGMSSPRNRAGSRSRRTTRGA